MNNIFLYLNLAMYTMGKVITNSYDYSIDEIKFERKTGLHSDFENLNKDMNNIGNDFKRAIREIIE